MIRNPILAHRNQATRGEINKINDWGCTVSWEEGQPGAFPVHKPGTIVMPDVEVARDGQRRRGRLRQDRLGSRSSPRPRRSTARSAS